MPNGSSIITTNSILAEDPSAYLIDYAGTKAAIKNTMFRLAKQLAQRGIRVNSVALGPIWTPLQVVGGQLAENIPTVGKDTLPGRAGQPSEVAGAYVFLASDAASYITATSINVTGANLIKFLSYIYAYLRENYNFIQSIEGAKE
ncbi:SDR family oxidoreductase [Lactobacillus helveticus]|nr:SDR family oxidoreductase [Lactobacillus helveticus]